MIYFLIMGENSIDLLSTSQFSTGLQYPDYILPPPVQPTFSLIPRFRMNLLFQKVYFQVLC